MGRAIGIGMPILTLEDRVSGAFHFRGLFLPAILAAELLLFSLPFAEWMPAGLGGWWWPLIEYHRAITAAAIAGAMATGWFSWAAIRTEILAWESRTGAGDGSLAAGCPRWPWLGANLLMAGSVAAWVGVGMAARKPTVAWGDRWFAAGMIAVSGAIVCWGLAMAPAWAWLRWASRSRGAIIGGVALGILARIIGHSIWNTAPILQRATLVVVYLMLRGLGQATVVFPSESIIGTRAFGVKIAEPCAGLEGIGLVSVFVAAYLWSCRGELRFPHALVLIPAGAAVIWTLNAIRVMALILLGGWSPALALGIFHSLAGWMLFLATAYGLLIVSRRLRFMRRPAASG